MRKLNRVAFTGLLRAGKDYVCDTALPNHPKYSFAEPMYRLAQKFFGTTDRKFPEIRRFYQEIGQLGHGYSSIEPTRVPPPTAFAATWASLLRQFGHSITQYGTPELWQKFGVDPGFWVNLMLHKMDQDGHKTAAVTNVRFAHEIEPLEAHGVPVYVVACSEETRRERSEAAGEKWDPAAQNDVSEVFARECYKSFPVDRIIWNDHRTPPNGLFLSVEDFIKMAKHDALFL